ncbi:MAG: hypothetical protein ThorAB25_05500 [Candidatus Thorarchaeota archaeon AB_25]|nr:MAG: hypothetical protein ThorAB25_05500 [Candidatus Thorarchaeota archaeon AB_25]
MKKIDDIFPDIGFIPALIITIAIGAALQLGGSWFAMLIAGALGSLFVRRHRIAFLVGFLGVMIAWLILFVFLIMTAQAMAIAEFFIGQLGLTGMGWLVIVMSCLLGGLLGGFGGLFGRSLVELIDELIPNSSQPEPVESEE